MCLIIPLLGIYPKGKKYIYTDVHRRAVYNSETSKKCPQYRTVWVYYIHVQWDAM